MFWLSQTYFNHYVVCLRCRFRLSQNNGHYSAISFKVTTNGMPVCATCIVYGIIANYYYYYYYWSILSLTQ